MQEMDLSPWDIREGEAIRLILSSIKVKVIARVFCGGRGLSQEPARESKDKKI